MLLTETNIHMEAYYHSQLGYGMTCSAVRPSIAGGAQGGVGLVTRKWPDGWGIKSTRFHSPNVVSYEIITGHNHTPLVGAYLPPLTLDHLPDLKEALQIFKGM